MVLKFKKPYKIFFPIVCILLTCNVGIAQISNLVSVGSGGRLVYQPDSKGNVVPDYSGVGYMNSESPIPTVQAVRTVAPVAGDNLSNVQNAINAVALLTPDANGFRGAILFTRGTYNVSDTIKITASGIVLRGEGTDAAGTIFNATKTSQHALFYFAGAQKPSKSSSSIKAIVDAYVPYGAKKVTVAAGHNFQVGNTVYVHRIPNQAWLDMLTMTQWGWVPSSYDIYYDRKVTAVNGNEISFDAPVVDVIDPIYAAGEVLKYTERRIEKCGIENMRITSSYAAENDNNHGWEAVVFQNIIHSWARNLEIYYFGLSGVHVETQASWVTVDNCKMLDAKSTLAGGERYSFNVDGQRSLVQNCFTKNGRHDYVDGSQTAGPNVFYNCTATSQLADIGPHHRWATGILFDNVVGDGAFARQNRTKSGRGHGWAGAQTMFWNCQGTRLVLQDPQGDHTNWAVGYQGWITGSGDLVTEPVGVVESLGTSIVATPSLFRAQLNERLGSVVPVSLINFTAVKNQSAVTISWATSSEFNNRVFYIQHSATGTNFQTVGQVNGNGTTSLASAYNFQHASPSIGNNFYRLKQVDIDGKITYSQIKSLVFAKKGLVINSTVVKDAIEVSVNENKQTAIIFFNSTGQQVFNAQVKGTQLIDVSKLPAGLYFVRTANNETANFLKQQ